MAKEKLNLSIEEIQEIQKELAELGILEEFKDYRITENYLNEFLEKYSDLSGQYNYKQGAVLLPLFKRIEEKYPSISEEESVNKVHKLIPIINAMLHQAGVFKLIKKVSKINDKKVKRNLEENQNDK